MERIENAINTINLALTTMDTITVQGIENMSRFVGSAQALEQVAEDLATYLTEHEKEDTHGG